MKYLFELGHQPHISIEEILTSLEMEGVPLTWHNRDGNFLSVESDKAIDGTTLMQKLGGTLAVFEHIDRQDKKIEDCIVQTLESDSSHKKIFCLRGKDRKIGISIKKALKSNGYPARFIEYKNTATIFHNKLVENAGYFFVKDGEVFVCRGIQPLEQFAHKDSDKPGFDRYSGMLPPKLARMMINLAGVATPATLLDPFCGSGVLLMEALDLGYHIIGSDISDRAVEDSRKNIQWRKGEHESLRNLSSEIFCEDVQKLSRKIEPDSIDLITCEPYMGKPLRGGEDVSFLKRQAQELATLYLTAFDEFSKMLVPGGVVVFIIPKFHIRERWTTIPIVDDILSKGFELWEFENDKSLVYQRSGQHIAREIFRFVKN
ncbi:methyltransferase domain-containing protein [Candidatus Nomurabacteria bacterium]|nr:methyltransferase domain-containing protein [Candidatus Nomurabacteria bacterium]